MYKENKNNICLSTLRLYLHDLRKKNTSMENLSTAMENHEDNNYCFKFLNTYIKLSGNRFKYPVLMSILIFDFTYILF